MLFTFALFLLDFLFALTLNSCHEWSSYQIGCENYLDRQQHMSLVFIVSYSLFK